MLNCPVCDRPEVEGNICPNCETDLSLIIQLQKLPLVEEKNLASYLVIFPKKLSIFSALVVTLILILGIGLGAIANSWLAQQPSPPLAVATAVKSTPTLKPNPIKSQPISVSCGGFYYQVKRGDSLSKIASNFYGKSQLFQKIIAANPNLKGRENAIEIGERFFVPNLEENCP